MSMDETDADMVAEAPQAAGEGDEGGKDRTERKLIDDLARFLWAEAGGGKSAGDGEASGMASGGEPGAGPDAGTTGPGAPAGDGAGGDAGRRATREAWKAERKPYVRTARRAIAKLRKKGWQITRAG